MGAIQREGGNLTFMQVMGDKFHRKVDKKTPGAKSRTNKDGVEVWELTYDGWEGYISMMKFRESKMEGVGTEIFFTLYDPDEKDMPLVGFSFAVSGSHGQSIMQRIENVDVNKMIAISPYKIPRTDKEGEVIKDKYNQGISIKQQGEKVESKYLHKEKEGDDREVMPPMVETKFRGKTAWDSTDRVEFLREKVQDWINENASGFTKMMPGKPAGVKSKDEAGKDYSDDDEEEDAIPF